jgi:hypothetical protein
MPNTISRRSGVAVPAAPPIINRSGASETAIRIGCLTDLNGPYADMVGAGSVGSIKLAIEDFHRIHPDIAVEPVVSDFSLKPDVGLMITHGWIDKDAVDAIIDVPLSPLALGIVPIEDTLFAPSTIRADGQVLRDMLLLQVKHPAASHGTWDSSSILTTLPADGLYVPLSTGGCKLIHT